MSKCFDDVFDFCICIFIFICLDIICLNALACPEIRDTPPKPLKVQGTCIKSCTVAHGIYSHPLISHPLMVPFSSSQGYGSAHLQFGLEFREGRGAKLLALDMDEDPGSWLIPGGVVVLLNQHGFGKLR